MYKRQEIESLNRLIFVEEKEKLIKELLLRESTRPRLFHRESLPNLQIFDSLNAQKVTSDSSSQDGGVGRNPLLPCTTKRRINNQSKINKQPEVPENQTV